MGTALCKLSIIIPHYNSPDLLVQLLKSIGAHRDVEVIVVDDKSTAEWHHLIGEYPYVRFIENQSSQKGPGTARNIGLDHASGDWILFADADDVFLDSWYSAISECFSSEQDIVFFPPDSIDTRTGERNTTRGKWYQSLCSRYMETGNDELLRSKFSSPCSKLLRRLLIEENQLRFDEIMHWEDSMFSAKLGYLARSVTAKPVPFYCINDHDGSMTTIATREAYRLRTRVLCEQYCFWKEKAGYEKTLRILRNDGLILLSRAKEHGWGYALRLAWYMRKTGFPVSGLRLLRFLVRKKIS